VAEPLPPALEATAWAEDGVNMGIRHRDRPLWGIQFHPESVQTEMGQELLANFGALTCEYHATRARTVITLGRPACSYREGSQRVGSQREGSQRVGSQREGSYREGSQRVGSQRVGSQRDTTTATLRARARQIPVVRPDAACGD
jgi:para-aminobenzoate synthetase